MKNVEDRRTRKTKKAIENAFIELLLEKDTNKITVKDVTERADINRGTFYRHYMDIFDLLSNTEDKIINDLCEQTSPNIIQILNTERLNGVMSALDYIYDKRQLFKIMLSSSRSMNFMKKVTEVFEEYFLPDISGISPGLSEETYRMITMFYINGAMSLIKDWLDNDTKMPAGELGELIENLIRAGVLAVKNNDVFCG